MNSQEFSNWFDKLKNIWEQKLPNKISNLCADNFVWYETPFSDPITKKQDLEKEWQSILDQDDISVSYEILVVNENIGIAKWEASFLISEKKVTMSGIFYIKLNEDQKCTYFKQWFNYR